MRWVYDRAFDDNAIAALARDPFYVACLRERIPIDVPSDAGVDDPDEGATITIGALLTDIRDEMFRRLLREEGA